VHPRGPLCFASAEFRPFSSVTGATPGCDAEPQLTPFLKICAPKAPVLGLCCMLVVAALAALLGVSLEMSALVRWLLSL
jgi:hypothetical protein